MKKNKTIIAWIILVVALIVSFYFDGEIVKAISLLRNDILSDILLGFTVVSSGIVIFFILTTLFLWRDNKRKWIAPLWLSLAVSFIVNFILKVSVQRLRPYQAGIVSSFPLLEKAAHSTWDFSFPSFQAMLAFCAIPILSKEFPKFKYVWFVFASIIAFSRVYFGLHFFSDVLAAGLIGYLIGIGIIKLEKEKKFGEKIYLAFKR